MLSRCFQSEAKVFSGKRFTLLPQLYRRECNGLRGDLDNILSEKEVEALLLYSDSYRDANI